MKLSNPFTFYRIYLMLFLLPAIVMMGLPGCAEKMEQPDGSTAFTDKVTCEGCHTDEATLKVLAPGIDEPPPSSGGG